jgi:hypothetical protein
MHGTVELWLLCVLIGEGYTALIYCGVVEGLAADFLLVYLLAAIMIQRKMVCGRVHMRSM